MNRYIKICIVAVVIVWIFCLGLVLGTFMVRHDFNKAYADSLTNPTVIQLAPESTSEIVIDIVPDQTQAQTETQSETRSEDNQEGFSLDFDAGLSDAANTDMANTDAA